MTHTLGSQKILLVDDDSFILDIYSIKLTERGHIVTTCSSAEEAIKKLRNGFVPNLIVSDLIMPFIDGFDFIRTIHSEHLADLVPVVVLSNQDDFVDFEKVNTLGVIAHYVKIRSTPTETANLLEGVMRHQLYPSECAIPMQ